MIVAVDERIPYWKDVFGQLGEIRPFADRKLKSNHIRLRPEFHHFLVELAAQHTGLTNCLAQLGFQVSIIDPPGD